MRTTRRSLRSERPPRLQPQISSNSRDAQTWCPQAHVGCVGLQEWAMRVGGQIGSACAFIVVMAGAAASISRAPESTLYAQGQLPGVEPLHDSGQDVTPAFEGWYKNADGTFDLLFGYQNRNLKEEL